MRRALLFIALAALLAANWPAAESRAAKAVIAAVLSSDQPRYREAHKSFLKTLEGRGYTSATTEVILQSPNPDPLSWSNSIRKISVFRPDVIVAYGAPVAQVATKEARGIPVISVDTYAAEQHASGFCGVSSRVPLFTLLKTVQSIRTFRRIGVVYSSREIGSQRQLDDIRKHSSPLGLRVTEGNVVSASDLDNVLATMQDSVDVIFVTESSFACRSFSKIISRTKSRKIPVISTMPEAADKGALVSLEISSQEQGQMAAETAIRILEGASATSLPLLNPHRIEMIINQRVAREMGLEVPIPVLGIATRVIR